MPSSLVFAALALAWLVILVPMVARRRQEVARTADSALAARVLRRGGHTGREEVPMPPMQPLPAENDPGPDSAPATRRYRPGRGGFDPEAAELAARARYAFRQRVVLGLLLTALATGLLAGFALSALWWPHTLLDLCLVGYLTYLRRQVRIEQEIRQRRAARAARIRREAPRLSEPWPVAREPAPPRPPQRPAHPGANLVELDDEDPAFTDLDGPTPATYRRAAGQ